MTLICSPKDVDKLISEMHCWDDDPDLRRIADAIPLEVLEAAYVAQLDTQAHLRLTVTRAETASQKLAVMRKIYAAWLRSPAERLGQLLTNAYSSTLSHDDSGDLFYVEDGLLTQLLEKEYPPPK